MKIIISPYSPDLKIGKPNPKNYPYWSELIEKVRKRMPLIEIVQVGIKEEKRLGGVNAFYADMDFPFLKSLVSEADAWISVDNFFPHFVNSDCDQKPGIVLWGQSDPEIFGYDQNVNLLVSRIHLRPSQYDVWANTPYFTECFVKPDVVVKELVELIGKDKVITHEVESSG